MWFVTYAYFKLSCSTGPPDHHGFAYKKKDDRYPGFKFVARAVRDEKKRRTPTNPDHGPRRRNRYAKDDDHGFPPRNIPKGARRDPNQHTSHLLFI